MQSTDIIEIAGMASELIGTLSIAYAALAVHHRFKNEHRVDDAVIKEMDREMKFAVFGVICMLLGFSAQIVARFVLN